MNASGGQFPILLCPHKDFVVCIGISVVCSQCSVQCEVCSQCSVQFIVLHQSVRNS